MPLYEVNIKKAKFLPCYYHLLDESEVFDIDFLYGGRDSGKSRHIAMQLIVDCLSKDHFKCLLIREVLNTVRDSQYSLIKSIIDEWKLTGLFKFNETRLEIVCLNGNGFYGRGLDDVQRIKSFNNPSDCWIEEGNNITNEDFNIIVTSLRSNTARVKIRYSFNPECKVNYTEFWLYQDYFAHTTKLSWIWTKEIEVDGEVIEFKIRATHTTYKDNPYCDSQRKALYEGYKHSKNNAYWYQTYTLGLWGYRRTSGAFWTGFDEDKHVREVKRIDSTYHIVVDNNIAPYIAIQIWQIDTSGKRLLQVGELPCEHPNNTASKSAYRVVKYLEGIGYNGIFYLYGDPSANAKSTNDDSGRSFFDKFKAVIKEAGFTIVDRVQKAHVAVARSGEFVNEILDSELDGWSIEVDSNCRKTIEDYIICKQDIDGTMLKTKTKNKETGQTFELHGHMSDNNRYFVTTILKSEYDKYKKKKHKLFGVSS